MNKIEYLYYQLIARKASPSEANTLLELDAKYGLSSIKRKWRKETEVKDMAKAEEYRRAFKKQIPIPSIYETAKQLRQSKDPNHSIF